MTVVARTTPDAAVLANVLATRGDIDGAFEILEKAARDHDIDLGAVAVFPTLQVLHNDPRWLPLLRRLGLAPEQLAAIRFDIGACAISAPAADLQQPPPRGDSDRPQHLLDPPQPLMRNRATGSPITGPQRGTSSCSVIRISSGRRSSRRSSGSRVITLLRHNNRLERRHPVISSRSSSRARASRIARCWRPPYRWISLRARPSRTSASPSSARRCRSHCRRTTFRGPASPTAPTRSVPPLCAASHRTRRWCC